MATSEFRDYPDIMSVPRHRRISSGSFVTRLRGAVAFDFIAVSGLDLDPYRFGMLNSVDSDFPPGFLEVYHAEKLYLSDPVVASAKGVDDYVTEADVFAVTPPSARLADLLRGYGVFNRTLFPIRRNNLLFGAVTFTRRLPFDQGEIDFLRRIAGLVHSDTTQTLMETFATQSLKLSVGELTCLRFAGQGMTSEQVSKAASYTVETVNTYMKTASRKLNAKNRAHAIAEALRRNLID
jgi:DNA-binding CsgD family transcriptional regulator